MYLGDFPRGGTVRFLFSTNAAAGARAAFSGALEADDIRVYKNGSNVERSSTAGFTVTDGFDSLTGIHLISIDLSDDTDAGFYGAGNDYHIVLYPDTETVDSQAPAAAWTFSIENRHVGEQWKGTLSAIDSSSITLPSGHGLNHEGNFYIELLSGTNAKGKARYLKYNSGEKWDVSPAWDSDGETTPSGTIIARVLVAPKVPTDATLTPGVNVLTVEGVDASTYLGTTLPPIYADAFLGRNQQGGGNTAPRVKDALAGGLFLIDIDVGTGVLTVKNGDGSTAFTRTLTRSALNAIISAV